MSDIAKNKHEIELFVPGAAGGCPTFNHWLGSPAKGDLRDHAEAMWRLYKPLCGKPDDFVKMFRNDMMAARWEAYLCSILFANGYRLVKALDEGPDLLIEQDGVKTWIECVAPDGGSGVDGVQPPVFVNE